MIMRDDDNDDNDDDDRHDGGFNIDPRTRKVTPNTPNIDPNITQSSVDALFEATPRQRFDSLFQIKFLLRSTAHIFRSISHG